MSSSGDGRHLDSALYSLFWLLQVYLFSHHHCLGQTLTGFTSLSPKQRRICFHFSALVLFKPLFPKTCVP